ncbi:hypothetical protein D3C75_1026470 [compost metagenome]
MLLEQQEDQRRGTQAIEDAPLVIEGDQGRQQQQADHVECQAEPPSELYGGNSIGRHRPGQSPQHGAAPEPGLPSLCSLAREPAPAQGRQHARQQHQGNLILIAPGQPIDRHQPGILIEIEASQQIEDRQLIDDPEPAQPCAQGTPTRIIKVLVELTGRAALFS